METKAITNNFGQGMTNIPSDAICPDDTTSAEYNLIFRDGEHRPIQSPVNLFDGQNEESRHDMRLLYIHSYNDVKRCIFHNENNDYLYWTFKDDIDTISPLLESFKISVKDINGITSIGNTLIISLTTEGHKSLHYFLWKPEDNNYKFIGTRLPNPNVEFALTFHGVIDNKESATGIMQESGRFDPHIVDGKQDDYNALVIGMYSKNKNKAAENKKFVNPFKIRYALKMYDGTYSMISVPIILFPSIRNNTYGNSINSFDDITVITYVCSLRYKNNLDLSEWSDIIKSVSVFITKQVDVYLTQTDQEIFYDEEKSFISHERITLSENSHKYSYTQILCKDDSSWERNCKILKNKSETDIIKELAEESVFFKIADLELTKTNTLALIDNQVKATDLLQLTTGMQLDHDDYYSHCPISSENIVIYNKRLHLSNVSRGYYEGATVLMPLTRTSPYGDIISYVYINTSDGQRIVKNQYNTTDCIHKYYYYPDPRAKKVEFFYKNGTHIITLDLKPHPLLNGAYFISDTLPNEETATETWIRENKAMPTENTEPEQLQNEVWVSEVNNPFVFNASGVNTVGNGSIIGVVSNTTALSQGQFGQFPLICFTTDGIYALQTSSTGIYSAAHPISREVCNNPKSMVATDHLVFFSSEKGLMMINGSQVTCVSQNLSGKTFYQSPSENEVMAKYGIGLIPSLTDFLRQAMIAYDYRDNLLWILNPNHELCYILSIDSGAYALTTIPYKPIGTVNDYPDTIIETQGNQTFKSFSLINRQNINDDERRIDGFIFSRPMKLGDSLALKTPTDIRLIENLNQNVGIRIRLFVSDDLMNWTRTNSYRGRGYKYFKYNLIFEKMLATDTISGIVSRWQFRYGNKLR